MVVIARMADTVCIVDCAPGAVVHVRGKCKVLLVDRCVGTHIKSDGALCGTEVVNCRGVALQFTKLNQSTSLDKCERTLVHLTAVDAVDTQAVTCMCTDCYLLYPLTLPCAPVEDLVWQDADSQRVSEAVALFLDEDESWVAAIPSDADAEASGMYYAHLSLRPSEELDARRQVISKYSAPARCFVTQPFELFDDDAYMGGFGGR